MKKTKFLVIFMFLSFFCMTSVAYAKNSTEADLTKMTEKKPKKSFNDLSDAEKQQAEEKKKEIQNIFNAYQKKVAADMEAQLKKEGTGNLKVDNARKIALEKYESEYFGERTAYGDGIFGKEAMSLFDNYGILSDFYRLEANMHDSCGSDSWFGDGICEGTPDAVSSPSYDKNTGKVTYSETKVNFIEVGGSKTSSEGQSVAIAAEGMFTKSDIRDFGKCNVNDEKVKEKFKKDIDSPKVPKEEFDKTEKNGLPISISDAATDKVGGAMTDTFKRFTNNFTQYLFAPNCDADSLSVISQFLNISRPLNITDNKYTMRLVYITQQIAFTMSIVIIAFFALMYTTGFQNMDPVKFGIRLFFCILAVTYLPWLMQDILNLNNTVVYNISTLQFEQGNTTEIIMSAFYGVWNSLTASESIISNLLLLILVFIMAVLAIVPMLRIVMWWYIRLLRILLGAIVGPILIMLAALPQTEKTAKTWITKFVGQVFEQVFMALALVMVAVIVGNIGDFGKIIGVGWFGRAMLVYSAIYFLAEVPSFAGDFLSNFSGGSDSRMANSIYGMGRKTAGKAKGAAVGAAAVGYGLQRGMKGKSGFGENDKGLSAWAGKKLMGTGAGKFANAAGHSTRNATQNFKEGVANGEQYGTGSLATKGKGVFGTLGALKGAATNTTQNQQNKNAQTMSKVKTKAGEAASQMKEKANKAFEDKFGGTTGANNPINNDFRNPLDKEYGSNGSKDDLKVEVLDKDEYGNLVDGDKNVLKWGHENEQKLLGGGSGGGSKGGSGGSGTGGNGTPQNPNTFTPIGSPNKPMELEYNPDKKKKDDDGGGGSGNGKNPPPHNPKPNLGGPNGGGSSGKGEGDNPPNPPSSMNPVQYSGTFETGGGSYEGYGDSGSSGSSGSSVESVDSYEIFDNDSSSDNGGASYHRSSSAEDRGSADDDSSSYTPFSPIQHGANSYSQDYTEYGTDSGTDSGTTYETSYEKTYETSSGDNESSTSSTPYHRSGGKERSSVEEKSSESRSTPTTNPIQHSGKNYSTPSHTSAVHTDKSGREEVIEVEISETPKFSQRYQQSSRSSRQSQPNSVDNNRTNRQSTPTQNSPQPNTNTTKPNTNNTNSNTNNKQPNTSKTKKNKNDGDGKNKR